MSPFIFNRTPSFADSDAAGVVHFSRLACYVEEAEHAFLARAGYPVDLRAADAPHWPRVAFHAEYAGPAYPLEPLTVILARAEAGKTSVTWEWEIRAGDNPVARGSMKTVCCRRQEGKLRPTALPEGLRGQLPGGSSVAQ